MAGFHFCFGHSYCHFGFSLGLGGVLFVCLTGVFLTGCLQVLAALDVDLSLLFGFGACSGFAVDT